MPRKSYLDLRNLWTTWHISLEATLSGMLMLLATRWGTAASQGKGHSTHPLHMCLNVFQRPLFTDEAQPTGGLLITEFAADVSRPITNRLAVAVARVSFA